MAKLNLAPRALSQSILPWFQNATFSVFNIVVGQTPRPDVEDRVLDDVGSYGRQIGRIGDALAVMLRLLDTLQREGRLTGSLALTPEDEKALWALRLQLAAVEAVKKQA
ncbi:hypothetical protein [Frigidibacter sp. MR17.24]|uniref:hypothetical protein n=1 Tax=Frigidibacter sp. MR17.24 TaxID=3127345 RepID=UPI003012E4B8